MKSKKLINRIVSFLTIICCLAGSAIAVRTVRAEEPTPRAVFTNEPNEAPDLYITKELKNSESYKGNVDALRFSFILKLNGKAASNNQEYTIIKNGVEKKNAEGRVEVYKTESGRFELAPGETAWFRNLMVGSYYEVTEEDIPESFQQVEPEGGAGVAGYITEKGAEGKFVNRYIPDIPGGTATLTVSKTVTFPEGYTAPETPDFEFVLTVDGEPYGMKTYALTDDRTGRSAGTGTTDADGRFKLKGGYTASFAKVKAGVDYKLEEENIPEGWRATGSTVLEGAVRAPETPLVMNNAAASFGVSKKVKGNGDKEKDFTFLLTKVEGEEQSVWAGAQYYLYDTSDNKPIEKLEDGRPESEEFENPTRTKADGTFTLKSGQAAIFVGIEPDTVCSIKEIGTSDYNQTLPASRDGYEHTVTDTVVVLPFENQFVDNTGVLTVTKNIKNMNGEAPGKEGEGKIFTFKLTKIESEGEGENATVKETSVKDAIYETSVGGSTKTPKTDGEGKFSLEKDETARFTSLPYGRYKVEEISHPGAYKVEGEKAQVLDLTRDSSAEFTFVNEYRADKLDLNLVKTALVTNDRLKDVAFTLWKIKPAEAIGTIEQMNAIKWSNIVDGQKTKVGDYTTDADGKLQILGLESGLYFLEETQTQEGYRLPKEPIKLIISRDKDDRSRLTVIVNGKTVACGTDGAKEYVASGDEIASRTENLVKRLEIQQPNDVHEVIELELINDVAYRLPQSGGIGIYLYMTAGTALMMAAAFLYRKKYRLRSA